MSLAVFLCFHGVTLMDNKLSYSFFLHDKYQQNIIKVLLSNAMQW